MEDSGLQRTLSGRDKTKATNTRSCLGGTSKPSASDSTPMQQNGRSFNLVVCGASNFELDGFIFADFMAFCVLLQQKGAGGNFLSCFPIQEHLVYIKNECNLDDIKFGRLRPGPNYAPILRFSRQQLTMQENFWEQVGPAILKERVEEWIVSTAAKAKPGDVVNIIIESHGSQAKGVKLGDLWWSPWEFQCALGIFAPGIQINAISGACHSGRFVDAIKASNQTERCIAAACGSNEVAYSSGRSVSNRFRSSRYEQAFVQSFARLGLFDGQRDPEVTLTVEGHEEYMREYIKRNFTPTATHKKQQHPTSYLSNPLTLASAVEDLVFRDKIDILYDPKITARRRRIEWPSIDQEFLNIIKILRTTKDQNNQADPSDIAFAREVIDSEMAKCDINLGHPYDGAITTLYNFGLRDPVSRVLEALYYRGRIQSAIWDVFTVLNQQGFLSLDCLRLPVTIREGSATVARVTWLLNTFQAPTHEYSPNVSANPPHSLWEEYSTEEAISWLATMIVRGCSDVDQLFETIEASQYLGARDENAFSIYMEQCKEKSFVCNPLERACDEMPQCNDFGFWLPHGLGNGSEDDLADGIRDCIMRFNAMERAYKRYFKIKDEFLLTEEMQVPYFDTHPEKLPGYLSKERVSHHDRLFSTLPSQLGQLDEEVEAEAI